MLGVVVLAVALFALRNPDSDTVKAGTPRTTPKTVPTASTTPHTSTQVAATPTITPTITPTTTASTTSARPPVDVKLPLVVLNNTSVAGLANEAKATFTAGGWTVSSTGNLVNNILSTCAYFDPSIPGAQASAELLRQQFPAIKRTAPKFAELPAGPIVVVLTQDYASS